MRILRLVAGLWLVAAPAWSAERIIYTRPDGGVSVVHLAPACLADLARPVGTSPGPGQCPPLGFTRAQAVEWIRQKDVPATAVDVQIVDESVLPPRTRPDPRDPSRTVDQRHQWRRGPGGTVIVDTTIKQPHKEAFKRALPGVLPPGRQAVITRDPQGAAFLRALIDQDWALARAVLADLETRPPPSILTPADVTALRALGAEYEIDL